MVHAEAAEKKARRRDVALAAKPLLILTCRFDKRLKGDSGLRPRTTLLRLAFFSAISA
jgi:hypothetical protein